MGLEMVVSSPLNFDYSGFIKNTPHGEVIQVWSTFRM